jgi:hypothetical protein
MRDFLKGTVLLGFVTSMFFASTASAGWMIVNDDGSTQPFVCSCKKKVVHRPVRRVKKVRRVRKSCPTCDYSNIPMAQLEPVSPGEVLPKAVLRDCKGRPFR